GYSKLDWHQGHALFEHPAASIEIVNFLATLAIIARGLQLIDKFVHDVVLNLHLVRRDIAIALSVEVEFSDIQRIFAQTPCYVVNDVLYAQYALRAPESSESRIGLRMGFYAQRQDIEGFKIIGIVRMKHLS